MSTRVLAGSALVLVLAVSAVGQVVFNNLGTAPSKLNSDETLLLNGSATRADKYIRLTPSTRIQNGSFWLASKQDVKKGFSTIFQFRITDPGDVFPDDVTMDTGGDGFAFLIQNEATDAQGGAGGGIGYAGISNSLAVEFDTWDNDASGHRFIRDVGENHVSVHTMGIEANSEWESYALGVTPNVPEMSDGDVHTVKIEYVPGNLYVYMDDMTKPILGVQIFLDEVLKLDEGKAWVGFTAATWNAFENHDILNWAFTSARL
jgi:hypothetical protein